MCGVALKGESKISGQKYICSYGESATLLPQIVLCLSKFTAFVAVLYGLWLLAAAGRFLLFASIYCFAIYSRYRLAVMAKWVVLIFYLYGAYVA
jgi:hypothetical protein